MTFQRRVAWKIIFFWGRQTNEQIPLQASVLSVLSNLCFECTGVTLRQFGMRLVHTVWIASVWTELSVWMLIFETLTAKTLHFSSPPSGTEQSESCFFRLEFCLTAAQHGGFGIQKCARVIHISYILKWLSTLYHAHIYHITFPSERYMVWPPTDRWSPKVWRSSSPRAWKSWTAGGSPRSPPTWCLGSIRFSRVRGAQNVIINHI